MAPNNRYTLHDQSDPFQLVQYYNDTVTVPTTKKEALTDYVAQMEAEREARKRQALVDPDLSSFSDYDISKNAQLAQASMEAKQEDLNAHLMNIPKAPSGVGRESSIKDIFDIIPIAAAYAFSPSGYKNMGAALASKGAMNNIEQRDKDARLEGLAQYKADMEAWKTKGKVLQDEVKRDQDYSRDLTRDYFKSELNKQEIDLRNQGRMDVAEYQIANRQQPRNATEDRISALKDLGLSEEQIRDIYLRPNQGQAAAADKQKLKEQQLEQRRSLNSAMGGEYFEPKEGFDASILTEPEKKTVAQVGGSYAILKNSMTKLKQLLARNPGAYASAEDAAQIRVLFGQIARENKAFSGSGASYTVLEANLDGAGQPQTWENPLATARSILLDRARGIKGTDLLDAAIYELDRLAKSRMGQYHYQNKISKTKRSDIEALRGGQ